MAEEAAVLVTIGVLVLLAGLVLAIARPQSRETATHVAMAGLAIAIVGAVLVACV